MDDLALAETRVVTESPMHGPEVVGEIQRLRKREQELLKNWAADDHEARMLRFGLHDIELAANAEGRPALAHLAQTLRTGSAERAGKVHRLLDALGGLTGPEADFGCIPDGPEKDELVDAYASFKAEDRR